MVLRTVDKAEETKAKIDEVEQSATMIAGAVEEQTVVTNDIHSDSMQSEEKSFAFAREIGELLKVSEKIRNILSEVKIGTDILYEVVITSQAASKIFDISEMSISDEELKKMQPNTLIKLGNYGHMLWKIGFLKALSKGEILRVERDHRKCLFGRSLEYLKVKIENIPANRVLSALGEPHARLHGLVERLEREVNLNDKERVLEFTENVVGLTFEEAMKHLVELHEITLKFNNNN